MKLFRVSGIVEFGWDVCVEAKSHEEAEEIAEEKVTKKVRWINDPIELKLEEVHATSSGEPEED